MNRKWLLVAMVVAAIALPAVGQATRPAPKPVIGVWYQPKASLQKWKDLGVNTVVGIEVEGGAVKPADYIVAAHALGLYVIGADLAADAFQQTDEPDTGKAEPPAIQAAYKAFKLAAPTKPVFISFSGQKMQWRPEADYLEYAKGADWLSQDFYPANSGSFSGDAAATQAGWDFYTSRIDTLVRLAAGKPALTFIETSDQDLRVQSYLHDPANQPQGELWASRMRGPTADEVEREVTIAMTHGGAGVVYFPQKIGNGWEGFDGTPPDVAARLKLINARLSGRAAPDAATRPATAPTTDPLGGTVITLPSGKSYKLTPAN